MFCPRVTGSFLWGRLGRGTFDLLKARPLPGKSAWQPQTGLANPLKILSI
jgi:hypothetical protein